MRDSYNTTGGQMHPDPDDEDDLEAEDAELDAAEDLVKAVRDGSPDAVVKAYRALREACDADYDVEEADETSSDDEPKHRPTISLAVLMGKGKPRKDKDD